MFLGDIGTKPWLEMGWTNSTHWPSACLTGLYIFSPDVMANLVQDSAKLKLVLNLKTPALPVIRVTKFIV